MDCQRRVYKENELAKAIQILTNLQVHVLNPVDMLRAPMDEGVLCFPYGLILDKAFELLAQVETMMAGKGEDLDPNWERLAELSRKAQLHYRRFVEVSLSAPFTVRKLNRVSTFEREAERRMSEVTRLTAVQRLQRLDSFLIDSNNAKLEKVCVGGRR